MSKFRFQMKAINNLTMMHEKQKKKCQQLEQVSETRPNEWQRDGRNGDVPFTHS